MEDDKNKCYESKMLNICINKKNYMEKLISGRQIWENTKAYLSVLMILITF